jgi:ATP-dependent Clp protease ATP-binding subunit ClpC
MPDRFDRFTQRARIVLKLAQEEAQRLRHNYIGTEHLLLGLVREGEGLAAKVLISMGVSLPVIRDKVEHIVGRGKHMTTGELRLTPRAKRVLELAVDEARRLNHHYVGTEHLLLGMIREGEGIAAGVLEDLGIGLQRARREVLLALDKPFTPENKPAKQAVVVFTTLAIIALTVITLRRRISRLLR